jgi:predicted nucleotidyltransferase
MAGKAKIAIPRDKIAEFCKKHHIRRLSLFGSVISENFRQDSDVDVLVNSARKDCRVDTFSGYGTGCRDHGRKVDFENL